MFKNYSLMLIFLAVTLTNVIAQEITSSDSTTVTQDSITVRRSQRVAKRIYPKEIPQPDYSNYHPVKMPSTQENDSMENSSALNPNSKIPLEFQRLDINQDERISLDETSMLIDQFFDGKTNLKTEDIYKCIDFFFEQ